MTIFILTNAGDIVEYQPSTETLRVIDRLSNIVKLAQAVFICPEHLENTFIESELVLDIYIYAEPGFEGVVCVVVPNQPVFEALANSLGFDSSTPLATLCANPKLVQAVKSSLSAIGKNHNLAAYEIPSSLLLEPTPFSLENGLMTPSLKLARPQLRKKYQDKMRELYYEGRSGLQPSLFSSSSPSFSSPPSAPSSSPSSSSPSPSSSSSSSSSPTSSSSQPLDKIISFVEDHTKRDWKELENEKIGAVGFDSVSVVQLSLLLKMVCSTPVPIENLLEMTVGELVRGGEGVGVGGGAVNWEDECELLGEIDEGLRKRDFSSSVHCEMEELSSLLPSLSSPSSPAPLCFSSTSLPLSSLPSPAPISIFLTGATGFLGIHILSLLLHLPSISTIYCLIRPSSDPMTRIFSMAQYYSLSLPNSQKISPVIGHLDQENFGLSPSEFKTLATHTDLIIHNASWVNGVFPYSSLKPSNVFGTTQTLRLASSPSSRVSRYCYVSTLSVFGSALSEEEDDLCDPWADTIPTSSLSRLSGYASSKRVSEILLLKAARMGLPVSFIRPGTICGSRRNHVCNPNDFITKYFQGVVRMGVAPEWDLGGFSMVDVDYVSLLCVCAGLASFEVLKDCCEGGKRKEGRKPIPVFHATGEKGNEVSVQDITEAAKQAGRPVETISFHLFRDRLEDESHKGDDTNPLVPLKSYFHGGFPVSFFKQIGDENACNLIRRLEKGGDGTITRSPKEKDLVQYFSLLEMVTKSKD